MEETHSPAKQLEALREKLRPVYGTGTDIVVSMLGLEAHSSAVNAAKEKNLTEAEAAHYLHGAHGASVHRDKASDCSRCPSRHSEEFLGGHDIKVRWMFKPVKPAPKKPPVIEIKNSYSMFGRQNILADGVLDIYINRVIVGQSEVRRAGQFGEGKLWINFLQQKTNRIPTGDARKYEGWKNAFMEQIEHIAKKEGVTSICFSTGSDHIQRNISTRPIHPEILETYGRLPMQHGYKLQPVKHDPRLWWVKEL